MNHQARETNSVNFRRIVGLAVLFTVLTEVGAYLISVLYNHASSVIPVEDPYSLALLYPVVFILFFLILSGYERYLSPRSLVMGIPHKIGSNEDESGKANVEDDFNGGNTSGNKL